MKLKNLLIALFIFNCFSLNAQNSTKEDQPAEVERSLFHLQAGLIGIWAAYEHQIAPRIAMRYDLGFNTAFWGGNISGFGFLSAPNVSVEPRFYHNLEKRLNKNKNISGNSGNFIALKLRYQPDITIINTDDNRSVLPTISITPTYGIRRLMGEHFNFEAGFGLGYGYKLVETNSVNNSRHFLNYNLHLRIGYTF